MLTKIIRRPTVALRSFSAVVEKQESVNAINNQHLRYIPQKRLKFDYLGSDGPLELLFESSD